MVRTWLQSRTRAESSGSNYVKLSEKEIDELVREWTPEPLLEPLTEDEITLSSGPIVVGPPTLHASVQNPFAAAGSAPTEMINLASTNFAGLAGHERIKERTIECLRAYGVGSCGPPGFYGTFDVHIEFERTLAAFLGQPAAIIYAQAFSCLSSVLPAFSKRGDIIVADRAVNFALQKAIQISRSTVRWYDHNDLDSLETVLESVKREDRRTKRPLTRRFIVTEAVFESDGQLLDLPRLVELKNRFKYRLVLDESWSVGALGKTGRGITELYGMPGTSAEIMVGSMANSLGSGGGFCAGSNDVINHQVRSLSCARD